MLRSLSIAATLFLAGCGATSTPDRDALRELLASDLPPGAAIDEIRESAVPGLLELRIGPQIYYVTPDGSHVVFGSIVDRATKKDLTAASTAAVVGQMLADVPRDQTYVYAPEGKPASTVYVFTDPTCPYCRSFHKELSALTAAGVEVVYLGFPRAGVGSPSYQQLTGAFCGAEPGAVFDAIMADGEHMPEPARCLSPVDFHYDLAQRLQVQGTPAIFDGRGRQLGGYLSAQDLLAAMERN